MRLTFEVASLFGNEIRTSSIVQLNKSVEVLHCTVERLPFFRDTVGTRAARIWFLWEWFSHCNSDLSILLSPSPSYCEGDKSGGSTLSVRLEAYC